MRVRLDLSLMNVSPSGLRKLCGYGPVADATDRHVSASGLRNFARLTGALTDATSEVVNRCPRGRETWAAGMPAHYRGLCGPGGRPTPSAHD